MKHKGKATDDVLYGLDVLERFVDSFEQRLVGIQGDVHYMRQWIEATKTGKPSVMKIKAYTPK
jgi:hypothetical protein